MEEVLDHNQEAEQIFRQYGRLLELVAAAQLPGRPEDAEECVQDAVWAFVEGVMLLSASPSRMYDGHGVILRD